MNLHTSLNIYLWRRKGLDTFTQLQWSCHLDREALVEASCAHPTAGDADASLLLRQRTPPVGIQIPCMRVHTSTDCNRSRYHTVAMFLKLDVHGSCPHPIAQPRSASEIIAHF